MWTQTCNQEYKPEYTLTIPERGVETTDKEYRKQTTFSETQGQIVGARKSLNRRENMAQEKSKER